MGQRVVVDDSFQQGYSYDLVAPAGQDFMPGFTPCFSPREMLALGVFEGKYLNDCQAEFPADWFDKAKLSDRPDPALNHFGIKSRKPLSYWKEKGWIYGPDPRGWFQWYCRYYQGRRLPDVDDIQVKRWRAFTRHAGQIRANCEPGDVFCRPRQRQGLLQWSHDPFI
ncbi:hypothetical protein ACTL6U_18530 [Rhodovibrionaceae bacterium A322]